MTKRDIARKEFGHFGSVFGFSRRSPSVEQTQLQMLKTPPNEQIECNVRKNIGASSPECLSQCAVR